MQREDPISITCVGRGHALADVMFGRDDTTRHPSFSRGRLALISSVVLLSLSLSLAHRVVRHMIPYLVSAQEQSLCLLNLFAGHYEYESVKLNTDINTEYETHDAIASKNAVDPTHGPLSTNDEARIIGIQILKTCEYQTGAHEVIAVVI